MPITVFRNDVRLAAAAAFVIAGSASAMAADNVTLMAGQPDGKHVEVVVSADMKSERAIVISTRLAGVAGSRIALKIDGIKRPVYEHIFTDTECKFVNSESQCEVAISGASKTYAKAIDLFKRGLSVHVEVETAGAMEMAQDASLSGFTAAFEGL